MKKIDPQSDIAETVFYQQFMTELYSGLEKLRSGLSVKLIENVGEDVQYLAFQKALSAESFEIQHDEKNDTYHLIDLLGQNGTTQRLLTTFNRLAHKMDAEPTQTLTSAQIA